MTVPGVNVICAATFMAAIGDIRRFESPRKLVGYLGLDPQGAPVGLGPGRPTGGSQSRARPPPATRWSRRAGRRSASPARSTPSISASRRRRGHQVAIVAAARKLACLFWCLLTREEDYAYAQPSLTRKKLRRLELRAGAPSRKGDRTGKWVANAAMREAERELAEQAEAAYKRTVADWQATQAKEKGRRRDTGARISWAVKRPSSAAGRSPRSCALARRLPTPERQLSQIGGDASRVDLTFMRRPKRQTEASRRVAWPPSATGRGLSRPGWRRKG